MLFVSLEFMLLFFPAALGAFLVARRIGSLNGVIGTLVAVSLALYSYSEPGFVPVMLVSVLANFWCGELLRRPRGARIASALFVVGIVLNLLPFLYFKYVISSHGAQSSAIANWVSTTLPLGISFFTFQQIAYLLDVRRGTVPPVTFGKYLLFVLFFPHLVAGPIVRHNELIGQFDLRIFRQDLSQKWAAAISLLGIALFKKVLIADQLAQFVEPGLAHVEAGVAPTLFEAWALLLSAAAQIYYDYSAYGDMALALALAFGLHLPISFYSPYQALSIADFWRRWNVTLMRFFRDHLYIPLGGNRHGRARQIFAIFVTMIACGVWHGAGGNFVAWGSLVAALIAAELLITGGRELQAPRLHYRIFRRALVLLAYVGPLAFFLFPEMGQALATLAGLGGLNGAPLPEWILERAGDAAATPLMPGRLQLVMLAIAWGGIYLLPNTYRMFRPALSSPWTDGAVLWPVPATEPRPRWRLSFGWACTTIALLALGLSALGSDSAKAFYYFRF